MPLTEQQQALVLRFEKRAYYLMWRYFRAHVRFLGWQDACSVARLALVQTALTFDPARCCKFTTPLWHWLRAYIHKATRRRQDVRPFECVSLDRANVEGLVLRDLVVDHRPRNGTTFGKDARELLAILPPRERQVLEWRYLDGLRFREIAERLGVKRSRSQQIAESAYERLRECWGDQTIEETLA